jgi:hypothetical protein
LIETEMSDDRRRYYWIGEKGRLILKENDQITG